MGRRNFVAFILLASAGCFRGDERAEVVQKVHSENVELRRLVAALSAENATLRARTLGHEPWTGTISLRRAGGPGGHVPFARACPRGEAAAGFAGTAGTFVDGIAPLCTPLGGPHDAQDVITELDLAGGGGGAAFTRRCPAGTHVVGLRGRAGDLIDAIEVLCLALPAAEVGAGGGGAATPAAAPSPRPTTLPAAGGAGGEPFERRCPDGFVVVGVSGRRGEYVNSVVLHCARP